MASVADGKTIWQYVEAIPRIKELLSSLIAGGIVMFGIYGRLRDGKMRAYFAAKNRELEMMLPKTKCCTWREDTLGRLFNKNPKPLRAALLRLEKQGYIHEYRPGVWKSGTRDAATVHPRHHG